MSRCFRDVSFQFVDLFQPEQYDRTKSAATENYVHPFSHIYVFGTKRQTFASSIYRALDTPATPAH